MRVKTIIDEDFSHYKEPSMVIGMPYCDWKCEKECGQAVCHNAPLAKLPDQEIHVVDIVSRFLRNPITSAVIFAGLEPMCSFEDIVEFLNEFRGRGCTAPVIIYTGYYREELHYVLNVLAKYENIIVKFGRYIPGKESHVDPILGVPLANPEQYAVRLERSDPLDYPPFQRR